MTAWWRQTTRTVQRINPSVVAEICGIYFPVREDGWPTQLCFTSLRHWVPSLLQKYTLTCVFCIPHKYCPYPHLPHASCPTSFAHAGNPFVPNIKTHGEGLWFDFLNSLRCFSLGTWWSTKMKLRYRNSIEKMQLDISSINIATAKLNRRWQPDVFRMTSSHFPPLSIIGNHLFWHSTL